MSAVPRNESAICNAAARFIGERLGVVVREVSRPDKQHRRVGNQPKAVDRVFDCGGTRLAVEHTRIESFPGQIKDTKCIQMMLSPLARRLTGHLPVPGHYVLAVAAGAAQEIPRREHKAIRQRVLRWVQRSAPTLKVESSGRQKGTTITGRAPGVPFELTLYRGPRFDGAFHIKRLVGNIEPQRAERLATALHNKCGKLSDARHSGQSCLVLESDDVQLANSDLIATAVDAASASGEVELPDHVLLLETELSDWLLWVVRSGPLGVRFGQDEAGPHEVPRAWRRRVGRLW